MKNGQEKSIKTGISWKIDAELIVFKLSAQQTSAVLSIEAFKVLLPFSSSCFCDNGEN